MNSDQNEVSATLKKVPLFGSLADDQLARLSSVVRGRRYRKGAIIVTEGDPGETLFFIKDGAAKVTRAGEDGREVILAFLRPDDLFGELSILDGLERSANVIAIDDSEVYFIERRDFLDLIQRYPALSAQLLQELARRIRASDQQIEFLALGDARSKVFRTLVRIAEDIGLSRGESDVIIGGSLSQQDLADMAGTSRETVSRALKNLEDEGLISRFGDSICLQLH